MTHDLLSFPSSNPWSEQQLKKGKADRIFKVYDFFLLLEDNVGLKYQLWLFEEEGKVVFSCFKLRKYISRSGSL